MPLRIYSLSSAEWQHYAADLPRKSMPVRYIAKVHD